MKTKILLAIISSVVILNSSFGQGALTPPGAPAPTMKTLAQLDAKLDPRTAITNTTTAVTISQPGSYYLTGNLTVSSGDAITIATNGVTLDLNGFTISSTGVSATGTAILLNGSLHDLTLQNGHIASGVTNNGNGVYSGNGFFNGIFRPYGTHLVNTHVIGVSVMGCQDSGIQLGSDDSTVVEGCIVQTVGDLGIYASTVKSCMAADCGLIAIYSDQVSDSRGAGILNGAGIIATTALNCFGYSGSGIGINANNAQNCSGSSGSGDGVVVTTAQNCAGYSLGGGYGIHAYYVASGCYGFSSTGTGLAAYNASFCTGDRPGGTAIQATIANGCIAAGGTNLITYKYNMP